ncbi:MAG: septal ring lytic transglycosylase RlpA family protein [Smithella sp.]
MTLANSIGKRILLTFVCHLALLVSVLPLQAEDQATAEEKTVEAKQVKISSVEDEQAGVLGIARYYAKRYKGRKTSSGVIYDPQKLTAAHPTLPLGTRVKVVNLTNNRSVIVTVNDRCRKYKTPFIDLSRQAAHQLDFLRQAKIKVRIIPLESKIRY